MPPQNSVINFVCRHLLFQITHSLLNASLWLNLCLTRFYLCTSGGPWRESGGSLHIRSYVLAFGFKGNRGPHLVDWTFVQQSYHLVKSPSWEPVVGPAATGQKFRTKSEIPGLTKYFSAESTSHGNLEALPPLLSVCHMLSWHQQGGAQSKSNLPGRSCFSGGSGSPRDPRGVWFSPLAVQWERMWNCKNCLSSGCANNQLRTQRKWLEFLFYRVKNFFCFVLFFRLLLLLFKKRQWGKHGRPCL